MHNVAEFKINPAMYTRSTPKAPLDLGTAEFIKGKPAQVQPAEMSTEQLKVEGRAAIKSYETGYSRFVDAVALFDKRWRELGPTRDLACSEMFGCGIHALRKRVLYGKEKIEQSTECASLSPEEDKKNTLTQIAALPPIELPELPEPAAIHAGAAPKAVPEAERKPRVANDNGKPIFSMPVWRETLDFIGKAINRNDTISHLVPSPQDHDYIETRLKDAFHRVEALREKAKKL